MTEHEIVSSLGATSIKQVQERRPGWRLQFDQLGLPKKLMQLHRLGWGLDDLDSENRRPGRTILAMPPTPDKPPQHRDFRPARSGRRN